jgi:two-component system response regulator AtoC
MESLAQDESLSEIRILVVDDEEVLAWSIENELKNYGADVRKAYTVSAATEIFSEVAPDLVVTDLKLPDGNGLDLIKRFKAEQPLLPIILMTAHGAIDSAITALRLGAFDYLQKPFDLKDLVAAVKRAAEVSILRQKVSRLEGDEKGKEPVKIVGQSTAMRKLRKTLERIALSKTDTILVQGESGCGKELAARAIHEWSKNKDAPYIEINCASIPENLLESELFGYEKGAFTDARARKLGLFEIARGGTIFLDEIGELPLKLQAKLLRALEYRRFKRLGGIKDIEFSARVVAATNRDLLQHVESGQFRLDLYYRLNVIPVIVPALREHLEDIPQLSEFFIERIAVDLGTGKLPKISTEALKLLAQHTWPGNIRELRNVLQRVMVLEESDIIKAEHIQIDAIRLPSEISQASASNISRTASVAKASEGASSGFDLPDAGVDLEDVEKKLLVQALERARFNQSRAAKLLHISRHALRYRLEKYGLAVESGN